MDKFYKGTSLMKNIYITQNEVMASDEDYENVDAFLEKINAEKKAMLDTYFRFEYNKIKKLVLFSEENGIQLFFNNAKGDDRTYIQFEKNEDYEEVLKFILSKCVDLKLSYEKATSKTILIKPILYTIAGAAISFALIVSAAAVEKGETIRVSNSKRGLKLLLLALAETLGFAGSIIVGIIIVSGLVYYTHSTYSKSKVERIVYS